jgi:hypothetical protein
MDHRILVGCLAVIGALLPLGDARAQPKSDGITKDNEMHVIVKARLYEVDEAAYEKLAKAKWLSRADLAKLEERGGAKPTPLFAVLAKQKPFLAGKDINIGPDRDGALLTKTERINCLPAPEQLRQGKKGPQTIEEGFTLRAQVHISPDLRFVRAKFLEKNLEIEGTEKVKVVDNKGRLADGEIVFTKEASFSRTQYIPDGGSLLMPLHYRPSAVRKNKRRLVAVISVRLYIEAEERERRKAP